MARIQLKRGNYADLPNSGLVVGEPLASTDKGYLHVATAADARKPVVPPLAELGDIPSIASGDYLLMHDLDGENLKEVKVTFTAFKTALNIPTQSTDEKVAVVQGGTSGYLWGTNGSDGLIRMGASMSWTKDAGDAYVTINVNVVDGGTFV